MTLYAPSEIYTDLWGKIERPGDGKTQIYCDPMELTRVNIVSPCMNTVDL